MNKTIVVLITAGVATVVVLSAYHATKDKPASFPTRAGAYVQGDWRYVYTIAFEGTPSEERSGELYLKDEPVQGSAGEVIQTAVGDLKYYPGSYNHGWLNTLTYAEPVDFADAS